MPVDDGKEQIIERRKEENGAYIVVNVGSEEAPVLQYRLRETWQ